MNLSKKPEPLPDDYVGAAHEWSVNIEPTEPDLALDDLVHELLILSGLTQIGVATNSDREVTSTVYHDSPYFIVNRLATESQSLTVKITYNRHDIHDLKEWAERFCSNADETAGLRCRVVDEYEA